MRVGVKGLTLPGCTVRKITFFPITTPFLMGGGMLWAETIAINLIGKPTHTVVIMLTGNAFNIYIGIALRYKQSQLCLATANSVKH